MKLTAGNHFTSESDNDKITWVYEKDMLIELQDNEGNRIGNIEARGLIAIAAAVEKMMILEKF